MFGDKPIKIFPTEFHRDPVQGHGGAAAGASAQDITLASGTYTHPNDTVENEAIEFLANDENIEITFDCTLLAGNTTIRLYEKTDSINYRLVDDPIYPTDFDGANVIFALNGKGEDMRITFQSGAPEGATRDIPHVRVELLRE